MSDAILTLGGAKSLPDVIRSAGTDRQIIDATTITASPDWQGRMMLFVKGCTVTIPSNLPADFSCGWSQESADPIVFAAGNGETLQSFGGLLSSAGQYAVGGIAGMGASKHRLYGQLA